MLVVAELADNPRHSLQRCHSSLLPRRGIHVQFFLDTPAHPRLRPRHLLRGLRGYDVHESRLKLEGVLRRPHQAKCKQIGRLEGPDADVLPQNIHRRFLLPQVSVACPWPKCPMRWVPVIYVTRTTRIQPAMLYRNYKTRPERGSEVCHWMSPDK